MLRPVSTIDSGQTAGRWDLYGPVHKGLRRRHAMLLLRLGSTDFSGDVSELLAELRTHLSMATMHLLDEEVHIHKVLEQRYPGAARTLERQHGEHRASLEALEREIRRLEMTSERQASSGHALYLAFSRFVADDLQHMSHEEEVTWPLLCRLFSDEELAAIEADIVTSLPPALAGAFMSTMVAAVNTPQRIMMLHGLRAQAPAEAYAALMDEVILPVLSEAERMPLRQAGLLA